MKKRITELVAEKVAKKETKSAGARNRALFLANRKEIEEAIDDGWSIKQIHETVVENNIMECSYTPFYNLVKKYIKDKTRDKPASVAPTEDNKPTSEEPTKEKIEEPPVNEPIKASVSFSKFNHSAIPKKGLIKDEQE